MKRSSAVLFASMSLALVSAVAHAKLSRSGDASVKFLALGPAGMKIEGTTNELSVAEEGADVVITVPLKDLKTGIKLRDEHCTQKYLQVAKYPNATLRVAKSAVASGSGQVQGQLSLHGATKPTNVTYTKKPDGSVAGSLKLNILDFGIEQPGYAGVTVKPDVDVDVSFRVTEN